MTNKRFSIEQVQWDQQHKSLRKIREAVFIQEQQVPPELEWDEHDIDCIHLLASDQDGNPIATGRMLADGHIGRMAVLPEWRNCGVGSALLTTLINLAKEHGIKKVFLYAQTSAIGFYLKHHFKITSAEFLDAGIPHREMEYVFEQQNQAHGM